LIAYKYKYIISYKIIAIKLLRRKLYYGLASIEIFQVVARLENVTRAAEELHIAQRLQILHLKALLLK
jgi:hypothetical protein